MAFYLAALPLAGVAFLVWTLLGHRMNSLFQRAANYFVSSRPRTFQTDDPNDPIQELLDFDYSKEPPRPYRPFKTRTHVAMGIQKCPRNDWIQFDNGYLSRLEERITTMNAHPKDAIGVTQYSNDAIIELFEEVLVKHVPKRFPTMFSLDGNILKNKVTGKAYDISKALVDAETALKILCENVEEDFYFMVPDGQGEWRLQGYIACFPGGFLSPSRLGQSFREIHQPVPHYNERIANGVDKFISRMAPGSLIQRFNWSLQTDGPDLFRVDGNNFYPEQGHTLPEKPEEVDLAASYLRSERQSLKCLPKSRAIVFCVRSYMTSLYDIVGEGNGVELAEAIESMPERLGDYKKRPHWQAEVYRFLRKGYN